MRIMQDFVQELFDFIGRSPTSAHTVETVRGMLLESGFEELQESRPWKLREGGRYFTTRGMTSLAAFRYTGRDFPAFSVVAPHGDSPCFKIKESPEKRVDGRYTRLNTEVYGGTALSLWLDRPLSAAGRLVVKTETGVRAVLADIRRDLFVIPSLAIHMNRDVNNGVPMKANRDTLPLFGGEEADLLALMAESAGVRREDVVSHDLYLYSRAPGTRYGEREEFIACPRLDDLECVFSAVTAFRNACAASEGDLSADNTPAGDTPAGGNVPVCAVFDNEEIGSMTRQGADSTLLRDVLLRICHAAGKDADEQAAAMAGSLMLSADNAHAVHPNYADKADDTNRCYLNGGVVVKYSPRYATDAVSAAVFQRICEGAEVPVQTYFNRSDMAGGSTLGNISNSHVSMGTVDIGLAQLAMHSPLETGGAADVAHMVNAMTAFYRAGALETGSGEWNVNP